MFLTLHRAQAERSVLNSAAQLTGPTEDVTAVLKVKKKCLNAPTQALSLPPCHFLPSPSPLPDPEYLIGRATLSSLPLPFLPPVPFPSSFLFLPLPLLRSRPLKYS